MTRRLSRKLTLSAAATALMLGAGASAMAGGYYGGGYYGNGYYNAGYYGHHGGYYSGGYGGHHGHHHGHHGHHGGGGKAAAIAFGVIGGAIILNELAEERARDRYYEDRYYRRQARYDRYARRAAPYPREDREYFPERDDQAAPADSDLDRRLEGGRADGGPEPIRLSYGKAYDACLQHARNALGNRGFILSAPYKPETAEDLGGSWKMTATVIAQKGSEDWSRAMYCEADDSRVYLLELI